MSRFVPALLTLSQLCAQPASLALAGPLVNPDPEAGLSAKQLLGKRLFEDTSLSEPQGQSCASCHAPEHAYQGNNGSRIAAVALGSRPETFGMRNTPTIMYMAYSPPFGFYKEDDGGTEALKAKGGQFWDGRAATLAEQARGPLLNPLEMNNPSIEAVAAKIAASPYAGLAREVYGPDFFAEPGIAMNKLSEAIAAFETTPRFAPFASKFDDFLRGTAKLTGQEMEGFALFKEKDKGNCIACHAGKAGSREPADWLFTDFSYDAFGAPRSRSIPANAASEYFDLGLCKQPGLEAKLPKGVELSTLCGAFKVPTLRNIAVTGPYFHNGVFASLRDAVKFYATRDTAPQEWYPKRPNGKAAKFDDLPPAYQANVNTSEVPYDRKSGEQPRLNEREVDSLVAFLKTLTDAGMTD